MKPISLKNAVSLSHLIVQSYIPTAKIIVDMTCGNGHDTEFLARQMDPESVLYAFDIQTRAVETTKKEYVTPALLDLRYACNVVPTIYFWNK